MKYFTLIAGIAAVLSFTGCGTKSSNNSASNTPTPSGIPVLPEFNGGSNPTASQPAGGTVTSPTMSSAPSPGAITLNPEHGQPGHRCDIAVGAPLTSAPVTAPATATTAANPALSVNPVTPAATAAPTASKAGLNPAHGQPGHRCDIAVGAPLDSKPATPAATPTPEASAATPMQVTPLLPASNNAPAPTPASNTTTAAGTDAAKSTAGLNPAHGQPGHRCDILVGQPLPVDSTAKKQ